MIFVEAVRGFAVKFLMRKEEDRQDMLELPIFEDCNFLAKHLAFSPAHAFQREKRMAC